MHRLPALPPRVPLGGSSCSSSGSGSSSSVWSSSGSSSSGRRLRQSVRAADAGTLGDMGDSADPPFEFKPFKRLRERDPYRWDKSMDSACACVCAHKACHWRVHAIGRAGACAFAHREYCRHLDVIDTPAISVVCACARACTACVHCCPWLLTVMPVQVHVHMLTGDMAGASMSLRCLPCLLCRHAHAPGLPVWTVGVDGGRQVGTAHHASSSLHCQCRCMCIYAWGYGRCLDVFEVPEEG